MIDAKVAVYTCIIPNNYTILKPPIFINPDRDEVHYWAILPESLGGVDPWWEMLIKRDESLTPRQDLQYYKMYSHLLLPEYDYTIWVDGNTRLKVDPLELVRVLQASGKHVLFGTHPWRDCSYEEGKVCAGFKSQDGDAIEGRMEIYRANGLPEHFGLVASTFFVRDNKEEFTNNFFDIWYKETMLLGDSPRNQISFGYAAYQTRLQYIALEMKWGKNVYYTMEK